MIVKKQRTEKLFAVSAQGLAEFTTQELGQLGLLDSPDIRIMQQPGPSGGAADFDGGGVEFSGDLKAIYRANIGLRTASRVLVRLGEFNAAAFSELRKKASRLPWEVYLKPGQPVSLRVTCHRSRLYHAGAVAERVAGAIADRLKVPSRVLKFDSSPKKRLPQLIVVRLIDNQCTVSVDSSGELLHRRGYRLATAKAPLRETMAAGAIIASGWDMDSPFVDPFCGSGTIAIEAALMARGIFPGHSRRFAFMDWPGFDSALFKKELSAGGKRQLTSPMPKIMASDRDAGAIEIAKANAQRAGVLKDIEFSHQAVSWIEPEGVGWVVTNPPYGLRLSANKDLRNLYAQFGNVLRGKCPYWNVAIFCSDIALLRQTGLRLDTTLSMVNGGVSVRLGRGMVDAAD